MSLRIKNLNEGKRNPKILFQKIYVVNEDKKILLQTMASSKEKNKYHQMKELPHTE